MNKRNDKHEDADSVLHHISSLTQCLYQKKIQNPRYSSS